MAQVEKQITHPIPNLNGTNKTDLFNLWAGAATAVDNAIDLLAKAYPHGRDYQLNPKGDYEKARDEHEARMLALRNVHRELLEITVKLAEGLV